MAYKKGLAPTLMIAFFIFAILISVIIAGSLFYGLSVFNNLFVSFPEVNIGNHSLNETYNNTLGIGINGYLGILPIISLGLIFGMIIVMMMVGYFTPKDSKMWILLDIFVIIICFIVSVYIAGSFNTFINSSNDFLGIYSNQLQKSSIFVLNLPYYIAIIGALIVIIKYVTFKSKGEPIIGIGQQ